MKKFKMIILVGMLAATSLSLTSCVKPYDTPEFITVEPSQTAFLVPLIGDTSNQTNFESEEMLNELKVATKEIQIPHRWVQTGRFDWQGEYKASARVIVVERKPETREWTTDDTSGTSTKSEGIQAKTRDDIKFTVNLACTAQVDEEDAAKFLYRYNNKTLAEIMDNEIKTKITSSIIGECAKYNQDELSSNTETIMQTVSDDVIPYFKERGITITALGLTGDFVYSEDVQKSIDNRFRAEKEAEAQEIKNQQEIANAEAEIKIAEMEAQAIKEKESVMESQIKLKELENEAAWISKWDGKVPEVMTGEGSNMYYGIDTTDEE